MAKHRVPRTRNGGTQTQAMHMGRIRSALRKMSMGWRPIKAALDAVSRPAPKGARHKREFQCAVCHTWHKRKDVQVDHIIPCGTLRTYDDLPGFCERLFCEDSEGFQVLCSSCHLSKTQEKA